jgi:hypothetical protein
MVLWANLHGGFLFGLLIIGIFGGAALVKRDWVTFKLYSWAGPGALLQHLLIPLDGISTKAWRPY